MSNFDNNPFADPDLNNPFKDPSVTQVTRNVPPGLDEYNPFSDSRTAVVRTMVKQLSPCSPRRATGMLRSTGMQPVEEPHAEASKCLEEAVSPWETRGERGPTPILEQAVLEGLHP
ncbi:secretory carrier-associated membrane protein 2-like, partial [Geospiza fortis]|uniref:Secretory carrier-associated membrane protein 2-like n=1 Tax=Geospiza fortis TaxID=48883 RepID=A0A8N5F1T2_GEOFO